jgi:hypothetical protein
MRYAEFGIVHFPRAGGIRRYPPEKEVKRLLKGWGDNYVDIHRYSIFSACSASSLAVSSRIRSCNSSIGLGCSPSFSFSPELYHESLGVRIAPALYHAAIGKALMSVPEINPAQQHA